MSNSNLTVVTSAVLPSATDTVLGGVMIQSASGLAIDSSGNLSLSSTNPLTNTAINVAQITNDTEILITSYTIPQNTLWLAISCVNSTISGVNTSPEPDVVTFTMPTPLGQGHTINVVYYGTIQSPTFVTIDGSQFYDYGYNASPFVLGVAIYTFVYNEPDTSWYFVQ